MRAPNARLAGRGGRLVPLAILALLAAAPLYVPRYMLSLLAEVWIFGIAAMSLNLLLGYTGMVSMGHAAFFATGAYTAGLLARHVAPNFWLTLPAGIAAAAVLALVIGGAALRTTAVTFLMLTLAFGQMLYAIAIRWSSVTGGSDGLTGIPRPTGLLVTMNAQRLYWVALALGALVYWLLARIVASPFGRTLIGIRENENRLRALGCPVRRYKLAAFVVAGGLAGIAGVLFAHFNGFVSPSEVHWLRSGQLLIMIVIGGTGTLAGPLLGSFVILVIQDLISSYTMRWMTLMGLLFIAFVLGARGGLAGLWEQLTRAFGTRAEKRGVPA